MNHLDHISIADIRRLSEDQYNGLLNYFKICGYFTDDALTDVFPINGFIWLDGRLVSPTYFSDGYTVLTFNEVVEMAMMGMIAS